MNKSYVVLSFIVFLIFNCINAFSETGGIGTADFYKYNVKFMQQINTDNITDNNSVNTIESNLGNVNDNNSINTLESNLRNVIDNESTNIVDNNSSNIRNNISRGNIITNTNVNVNYDTAQWLERIEVSDYTPDAGDTITIEGFGWNPNNYRDGIEITLSGGGGSDLRVGRIVPDNSGNFKIKYKLPKSYKYNDIIEVRCNGNAVALLQIQD
jgi:hypothetical protein